MAVPIGQQAFAPGGTHVTDAFTGSQMPMGVTPFGRAMVDTSGGLPTYSGGIIAFTPQATPQDFFTLTGNALVIAALRRVEVWIGASAAAAMELQLVFNTAPDTGGTAAVPVAVPHDLNDPAASCALAAYSVAPTGGTTTGIVACGRVAGPILAGAGQTTPLIWDWSGRNDKPPKLRSVNQQIALNANGAALPAGIKFSIRFTWTEILTSLPGA